MRTRLSQKEIILKVLRGTSEYIVSHQLEKVNTEFGWLGTSSLKRCRELEVEGLIEKKMKDGYVWYKAKGPKQIVEYRISGTDEVILKEKVF